MQFDPEVVGCVEGRYASHPSRAHEPGMENGTPPAPSNFFG
jgi:hypothetical protein